MAWEPRLVPAILGATAFLAAFPGTGLALQGPTWTGLGNSDGNGGISNTPVSSLDVCMALDPDGFPVVAWYESGNLGLNVFLRRWEGTSWIELNGSGSGAGLSGSGNHFAYRPDVAVSSTGVIYVTYQKSVTQGWQVMVLRWNGAVWESLAGSASVGISNSAVGAIGPRIAVDPSGHPWVTWQHQTNGGDEIYLRRWNGSAWVEVGGSASAGGISNSPQRLSTEPALVLDASGAPYVTWTERRAGTFLRDVYLRKWNGTAWIELGGSATGLGISMREDADSEVRDLAVDSTGRVSILWECGTVRHEVYLRRWNGSTWQELGGSASGFGISGNRVSLLGELESRAREVALDPDESPVVVWSEGDAFTPYQVRLRRWTGTAWEGADGSEEYAIGAGVGENIPYPVLSLDKRGDILVAWDDGDVGDQEIYLRRWQNARATDLAQFRANGSTPLPVGVMTTDTTIVFRASMFRPLASEVLKLQIELRPLGEPFTGQPTAESEFRDPDGGPATVTIKNLLLGGWRWRARAFESTAVMSAWESFGGNPDSHADFWTVAALTEVQAASSPDSGSERGCGLLGMEAPLAALLMALARRRRIR
jgi:hypothetical protein